MWGQHCTSRWRKKTNLVPSIAQHLAVSPSSDQRHLCWLGRQHAASQRLGRQVLVKAPGSGKAMRLDQLVSPFWHRPRWYDHCGVSMLVSPFWHHHFGHRSSQGGGQTRPNWHHYWVTSTEGIARVVRSPHPKPNRFLLQPFSTTL